MSKIKKEQVKMWQNTIPELQKNIDILIKQHRQKPIRTYPPKEFQLKVNLISATLQSDQVLDQEEYLDVFAFLVEERANISLLELGDQMANNFGKNNEFWTTQIQHWANLFVLSPSTTVWNVSDFMRNYVNYGTNPIQRHNIYQWRLKAQSYLSSIQFLIRKISNPKISEGNPYFVDDAYNKYYKAKVVYSTFVSNQVGMGFYEQDENAYNDELSITNQGKRKAEMKLFNFSNGNKKIEYVFEDYGQKNPKKTLNTLDKYFCKKTNDQNQEVEILNDKDQRIMKKKELIRILSSIGNNQDPIEELRNNMRHQKQRQKEERQIRQDQEKNEDLMRTTKRINMVRRMNESNSQAEISQIPKFTVKEREILDQPEFKEYPISHLTFIFDDRDYFQYVGYRIAQRQINISNPFLLYPWVNYWIDDKEEYDDLMAVDLDEDDADQSTDLGDSNDEDDIDDNIENDESFIDNRKVIVGGYIDGNSLTAEDLIEFKNHIQESDQKWVANFRSERQHKQLSELNNQDEQSRYKNLGLEVIPLYDGQLPYPIEGTDVFKTRRRNADTKPKPDSVSSFQTIPQKMEEIYENSEGDNSISNQINFYPRIQIFNVVESIHEVKIQKEDDYHGEETTFEQRNQI